MDCLRAQEIVSAAIGRPAEATPEFEAARAHCSTCVECRSFLQAVVTVHTAPAPAAPPHLMGNVMAAVAKEAEAAAARARQAEEALARQAEASDDAAVSAARDAAKNPDPLAGVEIPLATVKPRRPRTTATWFAWAGGGIAALLLVFMVGKAGLGMLSPQPAGSDAPASAESSQYGTKQAAEDGSQFLYQDESAGTAMSADRATKAVSSTPAYVTLGTRVYEEARDAGNLPSGTSSAGFVFTGRATGGAAQNLQAYLGSDLTLLYVETSETVLEYRAVVRTVKGARYVLTSEGSLETYGIWPTMPPRFPVPTGTDGGPTFEPGGTDETGAEIFVLPGTDASAGFAMPPDKSGGNPNWTWWSPLR